MRGFLGGVSIGAVIAVIGAVGLSVLTPLPPRPDVTVETPRVVIEPRVSESAPQKPAGQDADLVEAAPSAPAEAGTSGDAAGSGQSALSPSVMEPPAKPKVGAVAETVTVPEAETPAPEVVTSADQPVAVETLGQAPTSPDAEPEIAVAIDAPAQPTVPQIAPQVVVPDPAQGPDTGDAPATEAPVKPSDPIPNVSAAIETPQPQGETVPQVDTASAEARVTAPESETAPRIAALPQAGTDADAATPRIGTPVLPLTERADADAGSQTEAEQAAPAAPATVDDIVPFKAYAAPFENTQAKPLMSILLIDDAQSVGAEALLDFPYPLSFAIDPSDPAATEKMARYRAAGFEVVALADFPAGATAGDAETALEVWFATLPETVAVLEGTGSGIQGNRALSDQVTAVVKSDGRGLITQDRGLNTVQKLAQRDGVPSGVVFRDFDGAGQTPTVMRRFLDQAAFRAGQQGAVIMLGRVRPDTISALLLWGLQDRASRVALAPVSASLAQKSQ